MDDWDAPVCPRCRGKGSLVLIGKSWIEVNCPHCHGTGSEGAPPRPAIEPDPEAPDPVGQHPAVTESGLCPGCLGSQTVVVSVGGRLVQRPCTDCAPTTGR